MNPPGEERPFEVGAGAVRDEWMDLTTVSLSDAKVVSFLQILG